MPSLPEQVQGVCLIGIAVLWLHFVFTGTNPRTFVTATFGSALLLTIYALAGLSMGVLYGK